MNATTDRVETGELSAVAAEGLAPGSRRALVLVVDDDEIILRSLSQVLGAAYDVVTAADGKAALDLALRRIPDLVLADVFMPGIDGFELVHELRARPQTRTLPVILLTGHIDEKLRVKGLKSGADDYIVKPFNAQELLVRIESRLEMSRIRREAELRERRLRYEAEAAQEQLRFLADTAVILSSSLDLKATLAQVVELSVPRIGDWCAVHVLADDGLLQCVAVKHADPQKTEVARDLARRYPARVSDPSGVGKVMRTGLSELREEISVDDLVDLSRGSEYLAFLKELGIKSAILVPLFARDRILGTIGFACADSGRRYCKADLALTEAVAQRVALAVENAHLYHEARQSNAELEARVEKRTSELASANTELKAEVQERKRREAELADRTRQQAAVTQLGQLALANGSLSSLFDESVAQVARTLGVEMCKVLQLSPVNGCPTLVAGVGWNDVRVGQETDRIDLDSPAGFTLHDVMPVVVDDFATETRFHGSKLLREHGAVSGIIVSIGGPSSPWGVLGAYSSRRRSFTPDDVNFVQSVAHLLGVVIGRRELEHSLLKLSLRLMSAEDAERRRIAKELHDSTAQDLVAVIMNLELFFESEAGRDPVVAKQIEDSRALLENCAHEIRTLSYVLHPPRLDEAGLAGAIRHYVAGFGERTGLATSVELSSDLGRLGEAVEMILFRVVQESLGNIHRHSQSMTASVRLGGSASEVVLEVKDQGRGIPPQVLEAEMGPTPGFGVGIPGMRERLRQIGGHLEISSSANGTIVRATVPREGGHS